MALVTSQLSLADPPGAIAVGATQAWITGTGTDVGIASAGVAAGDVVEGFDTGLPKEHEPRLIAASHENSSTRINRHLLFIQACHYT